MATPFPTDDLLLPEAAAGVELGGVDSPISPKTLQAWRSAGRGPKYVKLGAGSKAPVRYRLSELRRWLIECERSSTADHSVRAAA
jgi:hypothetical protein